MNTSKGITTMSDEIFEKKLEFFLRSTGRLFPITPAQVEAFEKRNPTYPKNPSHTDPMAILKRGYINYKLPSIVSPDTNSDTEGFRMAARNGKEISPEILRKMHEDREKDENK
jgi:hypothetical protein